MPVPEGQANIHRQRVKFDGDCVEPGLNSGRFFMVWSFAFRANSPSFGMALTRNFREVEPVSTLSNYLERMIPPTSGDPLSSGISPAAAKAR